jgi:tetratricopeptide (TPR) repeat protein
MKKIFLLFLAASLSAGVAFAQEQTPEEMLNSAIELANSGNEAFEAGSPDLALEAFQQSMQMALNAGETGAAHVETCKTAICNIYMKMAKDAYRAKEWDKAVELFNKTKEVATEYGNADVATEAESLIGNTKANQLGTLAAEAKKLKDYATAASYYKQMVEMDPANGAFALQLGDAYYRMKDWDNAVAALESAMANGQEVKAKGLLSNVYLSRCQEALKLKKNQEALDFAKKANEYKENANAYKLGASAARVLNKVTECEEMYLKYLELKPNASDASDIKVTLAETFRKAGNKAKAREYFQMLVNDPKYGTVAKQVLPTLK